MVYNCPFMATIHRLSRTFTICSCLIFGHFYRKGASFYLTTPRKLQSIFTDSKHMLEKLLKLSYKKPKQYLRKRRLSVGNSFARPKQRCGTMGQMYTAFETGSTNSTLPVRIFRSFSLKSIAKILYTYTAKPGLVSLP
jgi:hypothetical protein